MCALVRVLFICLLVLAVPVQGAAAATMAFCGSNHHGGGLAGAEVGARMDAHAHHDMTQAGHAPEAHDMGNAASSDEASSLVKAGQSAQQKCSACATCCAVGAILPALPGLPFTESAVAVFTTVTPSVEAFTSDGPDRPPRSVLV